MDYEIYLWDADETLFDFNKAMECSLKYAFKCLEVPYQNEYKNTYQRINIGLWKRLEKGELSKEELKKIRMRTFFREIGVDKDADRMQEYYQESLDDSAYLLPDSFEVVSKLSETKRNFLVTNGFASTQRRRLKASGLAPFFEDVFISEELMVQKPDKRFFDAVFSVIGEEYRGKSIIIGDSLTSDIRGGNNAGIATCWLNKNRQLNSEGVEITREIYSLRELLP